MTGDIPEETVDRIVDAYRNGRTPPWPQVKAELVELVAETRRECAEQMVHVRCWDNFHLLRATLAAGAAPCGDIQRSHDYPHHLMGPCLMPAGHVRPGHSDGDRNRW